MNAIAQKLGERRTSPHLLLSVTCLGIFLAALDQTVVVTALPSIITDIRLPFTKLDQAAWIITGYLLGYTVAMPIMGRVSDIYGRTRIYVLCLLVFMAGSILGALAGSLEWLIGARLIQAMGGGAIVPVAMAMATEVYPSSGRGMALGVIGAVTEAGGVLGPAYGAVLVEHLGWRWIFWINLPLGLLILAVFLLLRYQSRPAQGGSVDYPGALLIGASLALLTVALTQEANDPRPLVYTVLLLGGAALSFGLFLLREKATSEPLVRLSLFQSLPFSGANAANFLVGIALIVAMANLPLFSATVLERTPLQGGLTLLRMTVMMPVGAVLGGYLSRRLSYRGTAAIGLMLSALGLYLMSRWPIDVGETQMSIDAAVAGLGFGLVISPIATTVVNSVAAGQAGIASALVTVMRMVGMMVGLPALTSWGLARFTALTGDLALPVLLAGESTAEYEARVAQYQQVVKQAAATIFNELFFVAALICLVALLPALLITLKSRSDSRIAPTEKGPPAP